MDESNGIQAMGPSQKLVWLDPRHDWRSLIDIEALHYNIDMCMFGVLFHK